MMKLPKPDDFTKAMTAYWQDDIGNQASEKLQAAWRQMGVSFNRHILKARGVLADDALEQKPWTVLPIPTGAGKTQGLCLYCSLLSKINDRAKHPGVLIVTRLIDDANQIRDKINDLVGQCVAVTYNSKTDKKFFPLKDARLFPVLIICHQAFGNALESLASNESLLSNWDDYTHWIYGQRKLTVIDESLEVVKSYHLGQSDFEKTYSAIPEEIRKKHWMEAKAIQAMGKQFKIKIAKTSLAESEGLIRTANWIPNDADFSSLTKTLKAKKVLTNKPVADNKSQKIQAKIRNVVCGMEAMKSGWAIHSAYKAKHTLSVASLILPKYIQRAVVLDATAKTNPVYDYLEDDVGVPDLPKGIRNYRNVTLHVCFNHPAGKSAIEKQDYPHFDLLMNYLSDKIGANKEVFFCVHKDTETRLSDRYNHLFPKHSFGHWGAIDGKNDWQDYDTMVIYGLPFLKPVDPQISIMAFEHWQSHCNDKSYYPAINAKLKQRAVHYADQFIVVRLVQAINRIKCRKVIDDKGNCDRADIYLFLHSQKKGEKFIEAIKTQMPGIRINVLKDVPTEKVKKDRSPYAEKVVKYLAKKPPGKYPVHAIKERFGMAERTLRRLLAKADIPKNSFAQGLKAIHVRYKPNMGAGAESFFVKDR